MGVPKDEARAAAMPNGLKEVYVALWKQVASAHASCKLFTQLFCHSQERVDLLNRTLPHFFLVVSHALRNSVVMSLCRLTDPCKTGPHEHLCLRQLTAHLEGACPHPLLNDIERQVEKAEECCKPFRDWRNVRLAHTEWPETPCYTAQPLPNITRRQVEDCFYSIEQVLYAVDQQFGRSRTRFDVMPLEGDGDWLVAYLEELEAKWQAERDRDLGVAPSRGG